MAKRASLRVEKQNTFEEKVIEWGSITLNNPLSKTEFIKLSEEFPDLIMEREKNGKTIIMSPLKPGSGNREADIIYHIYSWNKKSRKGKVFSSSTGIDLPDGSTKSPDCCWISSARLKELEYDGEEGFLTIVPDFVVELKSGTDSITALKKKMTDSWMKNGVQLAWLIDPYKEKAYIYRKGKKIKTVEGFEGKVLSGEDLMSGLEMPLDDLRIE